MYQLPYLDFSLEVISELNTESSGNPTSNPTPKRLPLIRSLIKFKPSSPTTSSNNSSNKITSTISGRFVAVMPNDGVPQVFIAINTEKIENTKYNLKVILKYATNEPVVGQKVEINFDESTTSSINDENTTITPPRFSPSKEGFTGSDGVYETNVEIDANDIDKTLILVANSGTLFTSIAIS